MFVTFLALARPFIWRYWFTIAEWFLGGSITWRVALRVWWAKAWRAIALAQICVIPVYFLLKPFVLPGINSLICCLLGLLVEIWATKMSLAAN